MAPSNSSPRAGRRIAPWSIAGAAALLMGLAACLPPPPPPPPPPPLPPLAARDCAFAAPTSAPEYQALFDMRSTVWAAGDSTAVVPRAGRSTVWLFGDTFSARVMGDGSLGDGWKFVNNSAMSEEANCLRPVLGGAFLDPRDLFADPGEGQWYWPGGAIAADDGSMQIVLTSLMATDDPPPLNFAAIGVAVARVTPDLRVLSIAPVAPSKVTNGQGVVAYGGSVATDETYAYLYAFQPDALVELPQYVARVRVRDDAGAPVDIASAPWEYSGCTTPVDRGAVCPERTWTTDPGLAAPMDILAASAPEVTAEQEAATDGPPLAAFHVIRDDGTYLALAKGSDVAPPPGAPPDVVAALNQVYAWSSSTPEGPWSPIGPIAEATVPKPQATGVWSYVAQLIENRNGSGWIVTWNANAAASVVHSNVRTYGPRFAAPVGLPWTDAEARSAGARAPRVRRVGIDRTSVTARVDGAR